MVRAAGRSDSWGEKTPKSGVWAGEAVPGLAERKGAWAAG